MSKYFKKFAKYIIVFILSTSVTWIISQLITIDGIMGLMLKLSIVCFIPNFINIIVFHNSEEYSELRNKIVDPLVCRVLKKKI